MPYSTNTYVVIVLPGFINLDNILKVRFTDLFHCKVLPEEYLSHQLLKPTAFIDFFL